MVYKWCVVPQCKNTTVNNPQKLFVSVPTNPKRRKKWLRLSRRDPNSISLNSYVFMCEDHFDMEKDAKNYMKYKMGFSKNILLTEEAMPTKFQCQNRRSRRSNAGPSQQIFRKLQRTDQSNNTTEVTETHTKNFQKDDPLRQEISEHEEPADIHEELKCNECFQNIVGFRYVCVECEDWHFCGQCVALEAHPQHYVLRVPLKPDHSKVSQVITSVRSLVASLLEKQAEFQESLALVEVKMEEVNEDIYNPGQELSIYPDYPDPQIVKEESKLMSDPSSSEEPSSPTTSTREQAKWKLNSNLQTIAQRPTITIEPLSIKTEYSSTNILISVSSMSHSQSDENYDRIKRKKS